MADPNNEMEKIERRLQSIELRLSRLETSTGMSPDNNPYKAEEKIQVAELMTNPDILIEEEQGL